MKLPLSRRGLMQTLGATALISQLPQTASAAFDNWPLTEGAGTPKLCLGIGPADETAMREVKQLGVNYVLRGGPRIPWQESGSAGHDRQIQSRRPDSGESDDRRIPEHAIRQAGTR